MLELEDGELADILKVSRPTVSRWARGEAAPHRLGRMPALQVLIDLVRARLNYLGSARASFA